MSLTAEAQTSSENGFGSVYGFLFRARQIVAALLDAEQGRWFLWLPVFFGAGVGLYFTLPYEPSAVTATGFLVIALALRILLRQRFLSFLITSIAVCIAAGFFAAKMRTEIMAAPVLERVGAYDIEGFVESFERQSPKRARAVVRLSKMMRDNAEIKERKKPFRVRIAVRGEQTIIPGQLIKLKAVLRPPPEPVMPGGYDFARRAYYQGIGASGYSISKTEVLETQSLPTDMVVRSELAALRERIAQRITAILPGQTGQIAVALTVGKDAGLSEDVVSQMRASGLYHIISISGLHMTIVAGTVFWFIRWLLALFPAVALRYSTRALAAYAALLAVTFYLALSGAAIASVRAYIMIVVVFLAILMNRPALSLRNVALSAIAILLVLPDSVMDISFQMSFAATAAIIATYERFGRYLHFQARSAWQRMLWQPVYFAAAVVTTTLVAGLATAPFAAYHFHNLTPYSALGNLLGGPPIDFIAMPAMVLSLLSMPFGLERIPLEVMGFSIEVMMIAARFVSALPGALVYVPAFSFTALLMMIVGGLWLIIWRSSWRLLGLISIGAGLAFTSIRDKPDIYVDRDAKTIAVRNKDGLLYAPKNRRAKFALEFWLRANGDGRKAKEAATGNGFQCDEQSCITLVQGQLVSFVAKPDALQEDCQRARILITAMDLLVPCPKPEVILDRGSLWSRGASLIYIENGNLRTVTASDVRGDRPWSPLRQRREKIAPVSLEETDSSKSDEILDNSNPE